MARSSPDWDLDSDEIASVTSQDLHDNRPNRWTGSQATWRDITVEERRLWRSMKMMEDQDLAIHLYNAHALKRRGKNPETAQDVTITLDTGLEAIWAPPKVWTAWPLNEKRVPDRKINRGDEDDAEDDKYTFRMQEKRLPSSDLAEELSAAVLRMARERFYKSTKSVLRSIEGDEATEPRTPRAGESDEERRRGASISSDSGPHESSDEIKSDNESGNMDIEDDEEDEEEDDDEEDNQVTPRPKKRIRRVPRTFEPMPSTNDDLSYELVKLPVRHIITQLDATLRILHNARVATADYASDSSATSDESDSQSGLKRSRGRPRSTPQQQEEEEAGDDLTSSQPDARPTTSARKRGRPKKIRIPREGETYEDMLVRVARESHRRLPATSQDKDAAFEEWLRKGDEKIAREEALQREEEELGIEPGASAQERRTRRLGLRSWSDVVGAAALAGFSGQVIARTAKRCVGLFGEGMTIRRLDEIPASRQPAFQTVDYRPETIHLDPNQDDDEDDDYADNETDPGTALSSRRSLSLAPFSRDPSSEPRRGRGRNHTYTPNSPAPIPRSRSRSRSRSSAGFYLCPIPSCERASTGFSRKQNLKRHMQLVHPGQQLQYQLQQEGGGSNGYGETWGEEAGDSEDEVLGAVHVDGFLKPILPTRGWRENPPPRKRDWGQVGGSQGLGDEF
ncbi:hypothetical protein PT974_06113 [Cladobotryum mycophilum]|uniref:C2H2-type domain-containing protein n=1 Tax=Cladobotryum mycophilum TaxID=491253 RepID=A0ABR0SKL1_9HYPO